MQCTHSTLPRVRGEGVHGWLQTEGVIALIAGVTHQHLRVLSWLPEKGGKRTHKQKKKRKQRKLSYKIIPSTTTNTVPQSLSRPRTAGHKLAFFSLEKRCQSTSDLEALGVMWGVRPGSPAGLAHFALGALPARALDGRGADL